MKLVFMGTPHAAVASLDRLFRDRHDIVAAYTQPDRPAGRGNKIAIPPVKEFALQRGLSILQPSKLRTPEALEEFRSHSADVAVVVAYGRILPKEFLTAFPFGAINVHFSLLPKYRGAAPVNWAIVHGEKKTGVTTIQMDEGLDTGPILMQTAIEIGEDETAVELMSRLAELGADLVSKTLGDIRDLKPVEQDALAATVAPVMKKEDGLISWMLSAREIAARVRGLQPFPTAFTYHNGKRLVIWRGRPVDVAHSTSSPGEVLEAAGESLLVFCGGDSVLRIEELQIEGKRRVGARDFINGVKPRVGDILGV